MGKNYDINGYLYWRRRRDPEFRQRINKARRKSHQRTKKVKQGEWGIFHILDGPDILAPEDGDGIVWNDAVFKVMYVAKRNYLLPGTRRKYWKVWCKTEPTGDTPDDRHYKDIIKP